VVRHDPPRAAEHRVTGCTPGERSTQVRAIGPVTTMSQPVDPSVCAADPSAPRANRSLVRVILALSWPVVLGQCMANAVPIIDLLMLGRLGTPALAAVGYASQFMLLTQATLLAIGAACVAMMARALGAQDETLARRAFAANLWIGLIVTGLTSLATSFFPRELLHALAVEDSVVDLAVPYFRLTLAAAPLMAIALIYESAFRSVHDTVIPMWIAGVTALAKVAGNGLFLFGAGGLPKLGLPGAGWATLISQVLGAVLFIWASRRHRSRAVRLRASDLRVTRAALSGAFAVAWPAVGERFVMNSATLVYFRFLGGYGVEAVAAYNVGVRILAFTWIPGLGLATAASTLVGYALGAGDAALARRSGVLAAQIGVLIALVLAGACILFRTPIAGVFTHDPALVRALDPFIVLLGIGLPFLVLHFTLSGALRGAGDTFTPLWAAMIGNWVFRVPLGYLSAQVLHTGLIWVWSIMLVDHVSRATWLHYAFRNGAWSQRLGAHTHDPAADSGMPSAA
jgi:putative MATE family efflux protein